MLIRYFVGVDISKASFSYTLLDQTSVLVQGQVDNTIDAIKLWLKQLKERGIKRANSIYCMEHTGIYGNLVARQLKLTKSKTWIESPLQIKRSLGLQRGKNDKTDSLRIAQYAHLHQAKFNQWAEPRPCIQQLKDLSILRSRLITVTNKLQVSLKENSVFLKKKAGHQIESYCKESLIALHQDQERVDEAIQSIIHEDGVLKHLFDLVHSVEAVGPVLATELIIATNEFKKFASPKKFACYCGIAPFEHVSGSSLQGKTRVSGFANKRVKSILHMAAISSISRKGELQDYYKRKVAEGRPKMAVLNAVRNKIIHRVFACVRDDRLYQKILLKAN